MYSQTFRTAATAAIAFLVLVAASEPAYADEGRHFRLPFSGPAVVTQGGWGHDGNASTFAVDFAPSRGELVVVAAARGTVIEAISDPDNLIRPGTCPAEIRCLQLAGRYCDIGGRTGGFGNLVKIEHEVAGVGRLVSYYGHLGRLDTAAGRAVNVGDPIGLAGNSGCSTGPHLHFEVRNMSAGGVKVALCDIEGTTWADLCDSAPGAASALDGKRHLEIGPAATSRQVIDPAPPAAAVPVQGAEAARTPQVVIPPVSDPVVRAPAGTLSTASGSAVSASTDARDCSLLPAAVGPKPTCLGTQIAMGAALGLAVVLTAAVFTVPVAALAVPVLVGAALSAATCAVIETDLTSISRTQALGISNCAIMGGWTGFALASAGVVAAAGLATTAASVLARVSGVLRVVDGIKKVVDLGRMAPKLLPKPVYAPTTPIVRPTPPPPLVARAVSAVKRVATTVVSATRAVGNAVGRALGGLFRR